MTTEDIEKKFKQVAAQSLGVDESELKPDAEFAEDLGADSLDCVELDIAIEDEFGIYIDDEETRDIKTVGQALEMVKRKLL
jgi:acyl carrier protein